MSAKFEQITISYPFQIYSRSKCAIVLYVFPFRHGDMLYIFFSQTHLAERPGSSDSVSMDVMPSNSIVEDEVDLLLYKEDGKIYRKKDEQL